MSRPLKVLTDVIGSLKEKGVPPVRAGEKVWEDEGIVDDGHGRGEWAGGADGGAKRDRGGATVWFSERWLNDRRRGGEDGLGRIKQRLIQLFLW